MGKPLAMLLLGLPAVALAAYGGVIGDRGQPSGTVAPANALFIDSNDGDDWPGYGRTFGEQHFSPLTQINDGNVKALGLAWSMDLGVGNPMTQPLEVGGTLYFASGESIVHAVDVRTGKLLWQYDPRVGDHVVGKELHYSWGIRGMAWWNGKAYVGTGDGRLVALDAKTGKELWSVQTTTKGDGLYITGAPRAFDGKIIIGQGGGDVTNKRGYATAYDAETGKQLWRFFVVPGDPKLGFENKAMEMAAKTWTGEWWKWGGGGEPWNAFTYDAETDTILIGTGNGYPWNEKIRSPGGGDNLFLCSMVAVDAKTGTYKWHYQFNPGETWDYNAATDMELADLTIDGQPRKVVMIAPKNGFFYVIDRTNGKLISAERIAKVTWASRIDIATGRPVEAPDDHFPNGQTFEIWPSGDGAHSWEPMAYSPQTKLVYIPKIEHAMALSDRGIDLKNWKPGPGLAAGANFVATNPDPLLNTSALLAWNPATQKLVWKIDTFGGWNGGVLATAGNLVFEGQLNGRFSAYDALRGRELWHFPAQAAVLTAPITYRVDGKQYVTVLAGIGTGAGGGDPASLGGLTFDYRTQKKRVLTFALDGRAGLPPAPPPFVVQAPPDPRYRPDAALSAKGLELYSNRCIYCHGVAAVAGGNAPDLRGSLVPMSASAFDNVVRGGALMRNGMPRFDDLTIQEEASLRQYVRGRAADLRARR
jgi:quinohemoprotein ethanol dehydrogenase